MKAKTYINKFLAGFAAVMFFSFVFSLDNANAASKNGFCIYDEAPVSRDIFDKDGNNIGAERVMEARVTIDPTLVLEGGILVGVSDIAYCPLPGKTYAGSMGSVRMDYLFSGIVCVVQAIISNAMLKVYCSILYWMQNVIAGMVVLYIMFYGLALMFDLGNNPARNAPKNFIKLCVILLLATNATVSYNWLYKTFVVAINGFSNVLTRNLIYDEKGQPVYTVDGKILLQDGREFDASSTDPYVKDEWNVRVPQQQYYFNPATKEFKEVFESEALCDRINREYSARGTKTLNGTPLTAEQVYDCNNEKAKVVKMTGAPDFKINRYFLNGNIGCDPETSLRDCRTPFNSVIGKFDAMFKGIVGNDQAKGLMGLVVAIAGVTAGGGPVLSMLLMSGMMAMVFAFFNMVFAFVTAIMGVSFMFMLAPVFVPLALFSATYDYFKRWLSTIISFTMQPILILAFLLILGNVSGTMKIMELMTEIGDKKVSRNLGNLNLEMVSSSFKKPLYSIPADEEYFKDANNASGATDASGQPVALDMVPHEEIKKWAASKLDEVKTSFKISMWANNYTISSGNPNGEYEGININMKYPYEEYQAAGTPITDPPGGTGTATLQTSITVNKNVITKKDLVDRALQIRKEDDDFETMLANKGLEETFTAYPGFDSEYRLRVLNKIQCKADCPQKSDGTIINPFLATEAEKKLCAKNCITVLDSEEKVGRLVLTDVLLFILLSMATAAFVGLIPGLCHKLSHWSPGAGAPVGNMSAPAIFGGSKRYLARGEYSNEEKEGVYHAGSLFGMGMDGQRTGAVLSGLDKMIGYATGGNVKNPIASILEGKDNIFGIISKAEINAINKAVPGVQSELKGISEGNIKVGYSTEGFTAEQIQQKVTELVNSKYLSGQVNTQDFVKHIMSETNIPLDINLVKENVSEVLMKEAIEELKKSRSQFKGE